MDASCEKGQSEGLTAVGLFTLAARTGELSPADDPAPPTELPAGEACSGVVTMGYTSTCCTVMICLLSDIDFTHPHTHTHTAAVPTLHHLLSLKVLLSSGHSSHSLWFVMVLIECRASVTSFVWQSKRQESCLEMHLRQRDKEEPYASNATEQCWRKVLTQQA